MSPIDFLLAALAIFVTVSIVYALNLPSEAGRSLIDQLDTKRVDMEAEQATKEDGWIADLERLIVEQKANLAHLRAAPPTIENLNARGEAVISIGGAERALYTLRARRDPQINDRRKSAAVHYEGRM